MASLHRDPHGRSPYYYAAFGLPNGKRAFRSTKQTNHKQALRVALEWEKAAELAARGELTEAASRKVLDLIRESVEDAPLQKPQTVREYIENWMAGKTLSQKESTADRYQKPVTAFLASLGPRADKSLTSLTPKDIENFRNARMKAGVSNSTVNFDLSVINGALLSAHKQGLLLTNPCAAVEKPKAKSQKRDVFSSADIRALLAEADQDWQMAILLGYYCGMRLTDAASLTWADVNLAEGMISYQQSKTDEPVELPIHPDLMAHLLAIAGDTAGPLCPILAGQPTGGGSGLSTQFANLLRRAGVDQRQVQSSKSRKFSTVSFHSLRHSFTSELANARISADVRMKLTGHRSADIHQKYTHTQLKGLREAIATLPRLNHGDEQQ
jgi:integrase